MDGVEIRGSIVPEELHAEPVEEDKEDSDGDGDRYEHTVMAILLDPVQRLFSKRQGKNRVVNDELEKQQHK